MQSTRTQALFRYLPGSVFVHEDGVIVRSYRISGQHIQSVVNRKVFLEELARELENWDTSRVAGVPTPGKVPDTDFVFIEPERIDWDIWPLLFACSNRACQRAKRFRSQGDAISATDKDGKLKCKVCHHTLVQIRYYTSHECGQV